MKERLVLSFVLFFLAVALPAQAPGDAMCGVREPDRATTELVESLLTDFRKSFRPGEKATVRVPVVVHMITKGREGNHPNRIVERWIDNLNAGFSGTPFQFELVRINRVNNRQWHEDCAIGTRNHLNMTRRLAVDPAKTLNVYVCRPVPATGMGSLPFMFPQRDKRHSVVIHSSAMPHGQGRTEISTHGYVLVHEVGHYLGLFHTFQGGCEDRDQVADTPGQEAPANGCQGFRDTCPSVGADDVTNYMDYANDLCWDHFTPGQIQRMVEMTAVFRPLLGK